MVSAFDSGLKFKVKYYSKLETCGTRAKFNSNCTSFSVVADLDGGSPTMSK